MNKKLMVILGMHRSGTSALTRGLQVMGVTLGERLLPAKADNETGFWEDQDIVDFNEEILSVMGSSWHALFPVTDAQIESLRAAGYVARAMELLNKKMTENAVFGIKDPRLCKLLDFWHEVFLQCNLDVGYVIAIRNPLSVVRSLEKRNKFPREKAYYMWLEHVVMAIGSPHVITRSLVVDYNHLLAAPRRELERITRQFDLHIDEASMNDYLANFLRGDLSHANHDIHSLLEDGECPRAVHDIYDIAMQLAEGKLTINDDSVQKAASDCLAQLDEFGALLKLVDRLTTDKSIRKRLKKWLKAVSKSWFGHGVDAKGGDRPAR